MGRKRKLQVIAFHSVFFLLNFPILPLQEKKKTQQFSSPYFLLAKALICPFCCLVTNVHVLSMVWELFEEYGWMPDLQSLGIPMGWGQCRGFLKHTVDWRKNFSDVVQYLSHPAKVQTFLSWVGDNFLSKLHLTWILHWRSPKVSLMEGCLLNVVLFVHLWNTCMCMQMHAHIWCMSKNNNVWLKKTNYIVTMLELNPVTFSLIYSENGSPDTNSFFLIQP